MSARRPLRPRAAQRGIALLEALLATVILAIGLLGAVGLQARSFSALNDASMRAEATIAAEQLFGLMSSDQINVGLGNYSLAAAAVPSSQLKPWVDQTKLAIPGAAIVITVVPGAGGRNTVTTTISWQRKAGGPTNSHTITAYLAGP
jgi:type IV pilus assembly protein PilV